MENVDILSSLTANAWYQSWPYVQEEDTQQISRMLNAQILSVGVGGILAQFERRFGRFAGTKYAVATNNGTAALYVALWAVGVQPGDDVLVCDYGFHGMAAAVLALGARVVPVDCEEASLTMSPEDVALARTARTRAVLVLHPWGAPARLDAIRAACPDLPIVSDASHAHGALYNGRPLAAWADITCFSLGFNKLISGGELGCAVTDSAMLRDRMLIYGHVNRVPQDLKVSDWSGNAVGIKLRPHPVALTLAHAQIERFDEKLSQLRATCTALEAGFRRYGFLPQEVATSSQRVFWRLVFRLDESLYGQTPVTEIENALRRLGVPVEPNHYWPLLQDQPLFRWPGNSDRVLKRPCEVAQRVAPRTIALPAPVVLPQETLESAIRAAQRVADETCGLSERQRLLAEAS
jgi:perosamine synthetase